MSGTTNALFPRPHPQQQAGDRASRALLLDFDAGQEQIAEAQERREHFVATLASQNALFEASGSTGAGSPSPPTTPSPGARRRRRRIVVGI